MKKKKLTEEQIEHVADVAADLYEKFSDVIPEGTNYLSILRAASSLIADIITRVPDDGHDAEKIDSIATETKAMAMLMRLRS